MKIRAQGRDGDFAVGEAVDGDRQISRACARPTTFDVGNLATRLEPGPVGEIHLGPRSTLSKIAKQHESQWSYNTTHESTGICLILRADTLGVPSAESGDA